MPMPRRRFFIPRDRIRDGAAVLTPDQAHHLRTVLRLQPGEEVELFDGEGSSYSGRIEFRGARTEIGALTKVEHPDISRRPLVLAAALIKADRFEWMLQKGTELGVDRFVPLETRFSAIHIPAERWDARRQRWQRIVTEASKQSRRLTVPGLDAPLEWAAFLASPEFASYARFMLYEEAVERLKVVPSGPDGVLLCVGPEGGWEDAEARAAQAEGFHLVSIGSGILRAETAALAAISVFQFLTDLRSREPGAGSQ
jgi:16S rRNA (uracil1498-N3)-methyltransferase